MKAKPVKRPLVAQAPKITFRQMVLPPSAIVASSTTVASAVSHFTNEPPDLTGLHSYQVEGVKWLRSRRRALLADDMGVGKTVQALRALPRRARAIVVAPASVLLQWALQVARWRPDLRVTIGEKLRRPRECEIVAVSWSGLPDWTPGYSTLIAEPLSDVFLFLDEAHYAKSDTTLQTQKVIRLVRQCGHAWGFTGTPMPNYPDDLWNVLTALELQKETFGDFETFVHLFQGVGYWSNRAQKTIYRWGDMLPEASQRLRGAMLRRTRKEVLPFLPSAQTIDIPVATPKDLRPYLDELKAVWDSFDHSKEIPPFELFSEGMKALARARIVAALEWARNAMRSGPLLVFSSHVEPIEAVAGLKGGAAFTGETTLRERGRLIQRFQAGEIACLGVTTESGGEGIELTRADTILFVDDPWTPKGLNQAIARVVRQGRKGSVLVARMVSDHPLDIHRRKVLDEKLRVQSPLFGS